MEHLQEPRLLPEQRKKPLATLPAKTDPLQEGQVERIFRLLSKEHLGWTQTPNTGTGKHHKDSTTQTNICT